VREGESEGKEKSKFLPCPYASMKRNFNLHVGFELEKLVKLVGARNWRERETRELGKISFTDKMEEIVKGLELMNANLILATMPLSC
jgi:hypothetical protein